MLTSVQQHRLKTTTIDLVDAVPIKSTNEQVQQVQKQLAFIKSTTNTLFH